MRRPCPAFLLLWIAFGVNVRSEPPLAARLADLKSPAVRIRARAAEGLAGVREPAAVQALVAALGDAEPSVRRAAARALGEQRSAQAVPALVVALQDRDTNVRFHAAHALGEIKDRGAAAGLLAALADPVHGVRSQAAWALRELRDPAIAKQLYGELARPEADVFHVAWLIRHLAGEGAVPDLAELLGHESPAIRLRAANLLVELGSRAAVPPLLTCLQDDDLAIRTVAANALVDLRDERAVAPLEALAERESDPAFRTMLVEAVRRLTMHPAIVAHWSFDGSDGKTVANAVPIGGNGEIVGGAQLAEGRKGRGILCGPGQYVELGQPPALPIAQRALTFTAWIKPAAETGVVIARGGAFSGFSLYLDKGRPSFGIRIEKDQPAHLAVAADSVPLGEWTHLAGVVRERTVEIWVNGRLAGSAETPGYLVNNAGQGMEIGFDVANSPCELTDAFVGVIDEVRMYHAALAADDIRAQHERER